MEMRKIVLIALFNIIAMGYVLAQGQEAITDSSSEKGRGSNFHLSLSVQSKYMWRGIEYGTSPVLFPSLDYNYKGFYVYAMGGYATDGSHQEVDMGISYTIKDVSLSVNDYYYPTTVGESDKYFNFKGKETGHWVEGTIQYTPSCLPLWGLLSTYFAGADKKPDSSDLAYSSYLEIGGHYDFFDSNVLSLAVGAALNKSFYNDYEHRFSVCNIALKYEHNFVWNKISIPVGVSYIVNPYREKSFVSLTATFRY